MSSILHHLLVGPGPLADGGAAPAAADSDPAPLRAFWAGHAARAARFDRPIDRALCGGLAADRVGFAFAAGYHAALSAMLPEVTGEALAALCATEEGGGHPRAIRTTLERGADGRLRLRGKKRWSTLATEAKTLFVVASVGVDESGKNRLRLARVASSAAGVRRTPMPPPPFVPEIPNAEVELDGVAIEDADVLEGDGYDAYLKPFRTFEDVHVHGALLGYLIGAGRRHRWPAATLERLLAAAATARAVAAEPTGDPATHVALAGLIELTRRIVGDAEALWANADAAERARWERDRALLDIAGRARAARRERAWERLAREGAAGPAPLSR